MVEISVVLHTALWTVMIGALVTDFYKGRFDLHGPYPRRPLPEGYVDRWPKKNKENETS